MQEQSAAISKVRDALAIAMERLEINDCAGEESEHLEAIADGEAAFRNELLPIIAAAPAMLAALQEIVAQNYGQPSGVTVPALDKARAAIAAATGTPTGKAEAPTPTGEVGVVQALRSMVELAEISGIADSDPPEYVAAFAALEKAGCADGLTGPDSPRLINHYTCPNCGTDWQDEWSAACNDECPACGLGDIEPHESEEIEP